MRSLKDIFKEILQEICDEENISYKVLSKNWIIILEKNGKTRFIAGYRFGLNSHAVGEIVDDKYGLYEVLKENNIPVIEHRIIYNKTNHLKYAIGCNSSEYVKEYFEKNNNHIVIKPNASACGRGVCNITDVNQIDDFLEKLFLRHYSISMCPFYNIKHEYRAVVLNGKVELLYAKYLPRVIGDGNKSIRQLLIEFNNNYFKNRLNESIYDRILANNEIYEYNWKFNLSRGSISKEIEDAKLKEDLIIIAEKVSNVLDLKFGSIDIIQTENDELMVLEVNSGVMMENYLLQHPEEREKVKDIYKRAILSMFEN